MTGRGPIIVTGADRSGTTLLYALLASHSQVSMVRRTNLWRWFYGRYGDLEVPANLDACLDTMMRYERLGVLEPDREQIREAFARRPATYGQLFAVMHEHHAERRGRRRWADKSLHTEHHAREIFSELPEAHILHLVRDPRDRYASIVRRYQANGKTPKGIGAAMGRWRASVRAAKVNAKTYGEERYRIVRYETLAESPETTLRDVCDFIGESYEPSMMGMRGVTDAADYSGNSSYEAIAPGEISTRSIGRYAQTLDGRTVAVIEAIAGRGLARHGYTRANRRLLTRAQWTRVWGADIPIEGVRTAGWLAHNRINGERKRTVPEHRLYKAGSNAGG